MNKSLFFITYYLISIENNYVQFYYQYEPVDGFATLSSRPSSSTMIDRDVDPYMNMAGTWSVDNGHRKVRHSRSKLTHWGRVTHICVNKLTNIGSDNVLSPGRRQAIIWTNAGILLIGALGTNFNEMLIEIYAFSFTKIHLKMSSGKWQPFCLGLNVLTHLPLDKMATISQMRHWRWVKSYKFTVSFNFDSFIVMLCAMFL